MENWIPFAEGEYDVDQVLVIAPDERAVAIENAVIEIFAAAGGQRHLKGSGRIQNILLVELLRTPTIWISFWIWVMSINTGSKNPSFNPASFLPPTPNRRFNSDPQGPGNQYPGLILQS